MNTPFSVIHPKIWNVPYPRNVFFTGRKTILQRLHEQICKHQTTALIQSSSLNGLGGIGKTQTAVEYAYQHQQDYQAVLWVRADSVELLISDLASLADVLMLPERQDADQAHTVEAVRKWLREYGNWLLILDNIDELDLIRQFLPTLHPSGVLLITTRRQATGNIAQPIKIGEMLPEEAALFLLERTKILTHDQSLSQAKLADKKITLEIAEHLGWLPLALDQAGAYIEEHECSLADYLTLFQTYRASLLHERGSLGSDHPASVTTTVTLAFEQVEQINPVAAELLQLCAFLHPDAIPEEVITEGAVHLSPILQHLAGNLLQFDIAVAVLRRFSLISRNTETKTLSIHRLVQAVLKDRMNNQTQRFWAEQTVQAVSCLFPLSGTLGWGNLPRTQRVLPHALTCMSLINQWNIISAGAALLLNQIGAYVYEQSTEYDRAEKLLIRACDMSLQTLGPEHLNVAQCLFDLGGLYWYQGKYTQAEPLLQQTLAIREKLLGLRHPSTTLCLNDLGIINYYQGKYTQAEMLFKKAMTIKEQTINPPDITIWESLNNIGILFRCQDKYLLAESYLLRGIALNEHLMGKGIRDSAFLFNNLAIIYRDQGKYTQSEAHFQEALTIRKHTLGLEHPLVAETISDWARLCYYQGKYTLGKYFCEQAIIIWKQTMEDAHLRIAQTFNALGMISVALGGYSESEKLYLQVLKVREQLLGSEHPKFAQTLNNLAQLLCKQGNYNDAEPLLHQALAIYKLSLGTEHSKVAQVLINLSGFYLAHNDVQQALSLARNALIMQEKVFGIEHPDVARSIFILACCYTAQGEYTEAESNYLRAWDIQKKMLDAVHPDLVTTMEHYATLLNLLQRDLEAEIMMAEAQTIREQHVRREAQTVCKI